VSLLAFLLPKSGEAEKRRKLLSHERESRGMAGSFCLTNRPVMCGHSEWKSMNELFVSISRNSPDVAHSFVEEDFLAEVGK